MNRSQSTIGLCVVAAWCLSGGAQAGVITIPFPLPPPIARACGGTVSRPTMLATAIMRAECFPAPQDEERHALFLEWSRTLPVESGFGDERFFPHDAGPWVGEAQIGTVGQARRANLTYSFPNDGVTWGLAAAPPVGSNNLNAMLTGQFGTTGLDRGREFLRQALASWRRYAGVTYTEVADNNASMHSSTARSSAHGDIRFGGFFMGDGPLAFNFFPAFGGDVVFNASYFNSTYMFRTSSSYRYLRNTMAHEHGHGLGFRHAVPCFEQTLMEPFLTTLFDMLQVDDRRGAGANYGDRFSGNQAAATALDFGNLTSPLLRSVIERNLSTNGQFGPNNSDEDWYRFSLSTSQSIVITVAPTGGVYLNGPQQVVISLCDGPVTSVNAQGAGDLGVELRNSTGTVVIASAVGVGPGNNEVLNAGVLTPGTYTVRVFDIGPNSPLDQLVQLYDMLIRVGAAPAPPTVIAGVNKRIAASTNCYFMGDISTVANEGFINTESYEWDLDGDGVFEIMANPGPVRQYVSNGVYPIGLRVADDNGTTGTDTILLTVFGGTTRFFGCNPPSGIAGTIVPIEITGTNLKNVTTASMVMISGAGITVSGTPTPNALGTSISGLSLLIQPSAPLGARNITVSNSDGSATGANAFSVVAAPPPPPGNFGLLSPADAEIVASLAPLLQWQPATGADSYDVAVETATGITAEVFSASTSLTAVEVSPGSLQYDRAYRWRVSAVNGVGTTPSTPADIMFFTPPCSGDADDDRMVDFADVTAILTSWGSTYALNESGPGDANSDDAVNFADVTEVLEHWGSSCP